MSGAAFAIVRISVRSQKQLQNTRLAGIYFSPCHESRRTRGRRDEFLRKTSYFSRRSFRFCERRFDIIGDYSAFKRVARALRGARYVFYFSFYRLKKTRFLSRHPSAGHDRRKIDDVQSSARQ